MNIVWIEDQTSLNTHGSWLIDCTSKIIQVTYIKQIVHINGS